jgi:hypothetical protein
MSARQRPTVWSIASLCGGAGAGTIEVSASDLDVAGKHVVEHLVEAPGHVPSKPSLATGGAFLHRDVENDRDPAVAFGGLGSAYGHAIALVTTFASHQRLLR